MAALQELILSTSSSIPHTQKTASKRPTFAPSAASSSSANTQTHGGAGPSSITLHDLNTSAHVHSFKPSNSGLNSVGVIQSRSGEGGGLLISQEGKALLSFWAWQKDQLQTRIHLPEKLSCFNISPDGVWAAGGSPSGHIYLWEIASGSLLASFDAHYRAITALAFTPCSTLLLTASEDSSTSTWSVARLVDLSADMTSTIPEPYCTFSDHTLAVRVLHVGTGRGVDCRVFTGALDGCIKVWALSPPKLLSSFSLPQGQIPTSIAVDPLERSFHVGTDAGEIHHVRLFRRKQELGKRTEETDDVLQSGNVAADLRELGDMLVAVGGDGEGGADVRIGGEGQDSKSGKGRISLNSPITALVLSKSQSHLVSGTASGHIYIHALPSHQHLRTITSHVGVPVTHLSTLIRPPDLVGSVSLRDAANAATSSHGVVAPGAWPVKEIKQFERMKVIKRDARHTGDLGILLRPHVDFSEIDDLDTLEQPTADYVYAGMPNSSSGGGGGGGAASVPAAAEQVIALEAELASVKAQLQRAHEINQEMWTGMVDKAFERVTGKGVKELEKAFEGDVSMDQ
ncbi:hypothetical protein NliqN6_6807 [Naganishia liquefaciens]|uniref:Pre-rRNA-processing protein IPI3 n=1 Tax=Naganishia liquefaciens TaxID=104408 RepID=A0A8H3U0Q1_9TREE|nr:hypothetical protein NliqN6_6807 [Naganishia liquefaciens]